MAERMFIVRQSADQSLYLPHDIIQAAGLISDTSAAVEVRRGEVMIRSARCYTLDELLKEVTPEGMRDAFSWDDDAG